MMGVSKHSRMTDLTTYTVAKSMEMESTKAPQRSSCSFDQARNGVWIFLLRDQNSQDFMRLVLMSVKKHVPGICSLTMMEFALARENQETSELVGAAELRADMTRGVALQRGDTVKKSLFRLKDRHYAQILDYLETNDHFAEIMGSGKKMKVGGKNQSKASAFGHMAVELRQLGWHVLTGAAVKKKTERYVENYRKALVFYKGTGSGVTEEERQAGVTMEAKMNALCPHFSRMHALFGSRPNVDPPALCMICIPADERNLVWDSQVDIGVDRMVDRIVDGSNFDDEIHEVEDAVPDEENQDDVSESVVEEIPSIGGNEASPIMNRHESAEASPSELIQMWIGTREVQCWSCSKMLKSKRQNSNLLCWLRKRNTGLGCWRSEKQYERRNRGLERRSRGHASLRKNLIGRMQSRLDWIAKI